MSSEVNLRKGEYYVFYPEYFDKNLSRAQGRRVPKKFTVETPTIEMLAIAAKRIGLDPKVDSAAYPRLWWEMRGRLIIKKQDLPKTQLLKNLAKSLQVVHEYMMKKKQEKAKEEKSKKKEKKMKRKNPKK